MYLLIHEDGELKQSLVEPTHEDRDCIDNGVIQIVRFNKDSNQFEELNPDNTWVSVDS